MPLNSWLKSLYAGLEADSSRIRWRKRKGSSSRRTHQLTAPHHAQGPPLILMPEVLEARTLLHGTTAAHIHISVANATVAAEGEDLVFEISIDQDPTAAVTVLMSTSDGTATAGADYTAITNQTVTFAPGGSQTQTVIVTTDDDAVQDSSALETMFVNLSSPSGATLTNNQAIGYIDDDERLTKPVVDIIPRFPETDSPTISWQPVTGAVSYNVWLTRRFPSVARVLAGESSVTGTSFTPSSQLTSGYYKFWVQAVDSNGVVGSWSDVETFEIRPNLGTPTIASFNSRPTFTWTAIPAAPGYELYIRTSDGLNTVIDNITTTSYTPSAALAQPDGRWWIRSSDAIGNRGWSLPGTFGIRSEVVTPTGIVSSLPTFSWLETQEAGRYMLHVTNIDTNTVVIRENDLTSTNYSSFTELPAGNYKAWIKAIDAATDSFASGLWSRATDFRVTDVELQLNPESQLVTVNDVTPTVSVLWDRAVQLAVINSSPGPTIASRAYAMLHTTMFDAWSAYDDTAISTLLADDLQRPVFENTAANKQEAMSFAAFNVLDDVFSGQTALFRQLMTDLGYDPDNETTDTTTPAGIGNVMATALLNVRHEDGSNQLGDDAAGTTGVPYSDTSGYASPNPVGDPVFMELWTPENVPIDAEPGEELRTQQFLTPHWGNVASFALSSGDEFRPEAPEPFLLVDGTVDLDEGTITLSDDSVVAISRDLIGTVINPAFISQAEEVVNLSADLTDEQKLIAEFWEDGGGTSFPPGTFMTFGQFVSARDNHTLDQDVQMFFALSNAVFDAGIATWEAKVAYDYTRPVRAIRELGEQGLIGEFDATLGGYAIDAWVPGQGTQTILATDFLTYQTPGADPSPPFAEYTSGHSAFSAAGATILELFTGSDDFGAFVTFSAGSSRFETEVTPAVETTLAWSTFSAAADEAGESRLYGGIHFTDGDINGRLLGENVGQSVWALTQFYITGGS